MYADILRDVDEKFLFINLHWNRIFFSYVVLVVVTAAEIMRFDRENQRWIKAQFFLRELPTPKFLFLLVENFLLL